MKCVNRAIRFELAIRTVKAPVHYDNHFLKDIDKRIQVEGPTCARHARPGFANSRKTERVTFIQKYRKIEILDWETSILLKLD